jgi:hypothetical protein
MSEQLLSHLPSALLYVVVFVVFLGFTLSRLAEASEAFAKVFGPLGRYWRRRVEQEKTDRIHDEAERKTAIKDETQQFLRTVMSDIKPPDYDSLKKQLINVLERVADMEVTERINTAYLIEDAKWHRETDLALAEQGILKHPLPERKSYSEFQQAWRLQHGYERRKDDDADD